MAAAAHQPLGWLARRGGVTQSWKMRWCECVPDSPVLVCFYRAPPPPHGSDSPAPAGTSGGGLHAPTGAVAVVDVRTEEDGREIWIRAPGGGPEIALRATSVDAATVAAVTLRAMLQAGGARVGSRAGAGAGMVDSGIPAAVSASAAAAAVVSAEAAATVAGAVGGARGGGIEAIREARRAVGTFPTLEDLLVDRRRARRRSADVDAAEADGERAAAAMPKDTFLRVGVAQAREGLLDQAAASFEKAERVALRRRRLCGQGQKSPGVGVEEDSRVGEGKFGLIAVWAQYLLGKVRFRQNAHDAAASALGSAIELLRQLETTAVPSDTEGYRVAKMGVSDLKDDLLLWAARIQDALGNTPAAVQLYEQLLQSRSGDSVATTALETLHQRQARANMDAASKAQAQDQGVATCMPDEQHQQQQQQQQQQRQRQQQRRPPKGRPLRSPRPEARESAHVLKENGLGHTSSQHQHREPRHQHLHQRRLESPAVVPPLPLGPPPSTNNNLKT